MAKKNFRKIPGRIISKANNMNSRYLIVGCLLTITKEEISNGLFSHLGISLTENGIQFPETIIPDPEQGKYSDRNVNGYEIVRKDLGKFKKYRTMEVPNFGDSSRGTHLVDIPQYVYPRDFYSPRLINLQIECPNTSLELNSYAIKFQLDEILDKESNDFEANLLYLINLLQENIFHCDIMSSTSTYQDYLTTVKLAWEILPPGDKNIIIRKILSSNANLEQKQTIEERYNFLMSLNPRDIIVGTSGMQRYLGALINDDLVVFENTQYGNAIYIMYDNWEELSQRSRTDLIEGRFGNNFDRITHVPGWKKLVKKIVREKLRNG